jgi:ankyrin repeat protein
MFAAKNSYNDSLNQLVLQNSANINEEDKNCMTILMHVLLADKPDFKLAKRLIRKGANVDHID